MANKILVARGTKARLEEVKSSLAVNELVYSTDTGELGVKKANGNIEYFKPDSYYYTKSEANNTFAYTVHSHSNYVPTTRTINAKALSSNITLSIDDLISNASGEGYMLTHNGSFWLSAPIATVIGDVVDDAVNDAVEDLDIPTDLDDLVVAGVDQVPVRTSVGWVGASQVPDSTRWNGYRIRVGSYSSGRSNYITFGI